MRIPARRRLGLAGLLVAILSIAVGPLRVAEAALGPGSFTKHAFSNGTAARDYWLYVPTAPAAGPRPLVVYLHGCNQTATDAAIGTRWNEVAEQRGFVVAYPEQRVNPEEGGVGDGNGVGCWNWFLPEHQQRDAGEPALIAGITRAVTASAGVDPSRVYILGASAGADMAVTMAAAYPDLYAASAAFGGCAYRTCTDLDGSAAYAAMGTHARVVPSMIVQGTIDLLNNFAMGETLVSQQVGTNDLADGLPAGSVPRLPSSTEHVGWDATLVDNAGTVGDTCVRNRQFPCAGAVLGLDSYPYSIERHADAAGCSVVDFWIIHGLGHDYPGGDPAGTFTDPIGPDITTAAYDFFSQHRLGAAPCAASAPPPVVPEAPAALLPLAALAVVVVTVGRRRAA